VIAVEVASLACLPLYRSGVADGLARSNMYLCLEV